MSVIEFEMLKWALNNEEGLSSIQIEEEKLIKSVKYHRLSGRILKKTEKINKNPFSDYVIDNLNKLQEEAHISHSSQISFLRELSSIVDNIGPIIPIKGFTTYAHTGDERAIRFSLDLDIFFIDSAVLNTILLNMGYIDNFTGVGHEFSKLTKENVQLDIELHNWFTIFKNPQKGHAQEGEIHQKQINYEQMLENTVKGSTEDTKDLIIPNIHTLVLIKCSHLFKNYLNFEKPLRLNELVEIMELSLDNKFRIHKFYELVDKFEGQDAVSFVGYLLKEVFNKNTLGLSGDPWLYTYNAVEIFTDSTKLNEYIKRIHPNIVILSPFTPTYLPVETSYLWIGETEKEFPYEIYFLNENNILLVQLKIPLSPFEQNRGRVVMKFDYWKTLYLVFEKGELLETGGIATSKLSKSSTEYCFNIEIPISQIRINDSNEIHSIIQFYKFNKKNECIYEVVPIEIKI
ncbi:nucleotidyltransferase family protein [Paenibacillus glycinis]|uniref:Nucleotidyltransferase family protein n=1 Tax=Paenibacillus glycinis TaxID=2697035 RepID=A0ABW9XSM3_9BACL|nr:nucleotidyltransferase family protein [Paenibacillus glycinis]NBD25536.1 hypothetical protein [Paenibacillus glycinis]